MDDLELFDDLEQKELEKRADYISTEDLLKWNAKIDFYKEIQKDILSKKSLLFAGPRGTGKTHQLKIAHEACLASKDLPLSIYVSFSKYYYLEPLLTRVSNARQVFHTWVLSKTIADLYRQSLLVVKDFSFEVYFGFTLEHLESFISKSEKGMYSAEADDIIIETVSIAKVVEFIKFALKELKRKRAILLMDDAALTLTHEYLIEFFDVFRSLKTEFITPKATVYPGSTEYGPRFHIGEDADIKKIWLEFNTDEYSSLVDQIVDLRLPNLKEKIPSDILELLKIASFGIPRAFITLATIYLSVEQSKSTQVKFNRALEIHTNALITEFLSLKEKLPQFSTLVLSGKNFFSISINDLIRENKESKNEKQLYIGVDSNLSRMEARMLTFLVEAGLYFDHELPVKHGEKREYMRYTPHIAFLLKERAFSVSRGFDAKSILEKINLPNKKHPLRRTISTALGSEAGLKLDLPPCQNCGTQRIAPEQKFCHNCGVELISPSSFEQCMEQSIEELPLTPWQKDKILKETVFSKIGDFFVTPDPATKLKEAFGIGRVKAELIYKKVMHYVDEYLS